MMNKDYPLLPPPFLKNIKMGEVNQVFLPCPCSKNAKTWEVEQVFLLQNPDPGFLGRWPNEVRQEGVNHA